MATEFVNLPSKGKQDYVTLALQLHKELPVCKNDKKRLLIAESFSGPLAIRLAALRPDEIGGIVLASSFCNAPLKRGIAISVALLPLRPLFLVKPPRSALRHFLIGDDVNDSELEVLRKVMEEIPSSTLSKRVRTIIELMQDDNPDLPDIPVLILQAQNDNLVPWEAQSNLESYYPQAKTHWLEAPHLIFQRRPDECLRHIMDFASEIGSSCS